VLGTESSTRPPEWLPGALLSYLQPPEIITLKECTGNIVAE
jgi:hypothetical protein